MARKRTRGGSNDPPTAATPESDPTPSAEADGRASEPPEEVAEIVEAAEVPEILETPAVPAVDADEDAGRGLVRYDPLQAYFREMQRHPLLKPEEEHDLAVRFHTTGDLKAAARMVTANLRLVVKLAYEYRRAYRNVMDLIQEGNVGLLQAVKHFDPYRGVKFSSYAAFWIRAYILRYLIHNFRLVKIGTTQAQRKLFFNLNREKARLSALGFDPSPAKIAERLDVTEQEVVEMDRRMTGSELTLDAPAGGADAEGRPTARIELLPSAATPADEEIIDHQLNDRLHQKLDEFAKTLSDKDKIIYEKRLVADEPMTLQQIGDTFGVSRERIRQIEKRLQDRLKSYLEKEMGELLTFDG